jgi:ABC-type phosphate transport system substrate-binding protein
MKTYSILVLIPVLALVSGFTNLAAESELSKTEVVRAAYNTENELVVIVNNANPVAAMTASQVKLTYLRKINKRWKELNKNIVPLDRKSDNEARKMFMKDVLQMSSDEVVRYFTEREYQNAEAPPVKFASDDEIIEYVENNVGAIAYVSKSSIKADSKVKVVLSL